MMNSGKIAGQALKAMNAENKIQSADIAGMVEAARKSLEAVNNPAQAKALKDLTAGFMKSTKLVEAQTDLLASLTIPEPPDGDKEAAAALKEIESTIKRITDENRKQIDELEDLTRQAEEEAKDSGDQDGAKKVKKVKKATELLEKARKLVEEQSKLLDEARKTLAD